MEIGQPHGVQCSLLPIQEVRGALISIAESSEQLVSRRTYLAAAACTLLPVASPIFLLIRDAEANTCFYIRMGRVEPINSSKHAASV